MAKILGMIPFGFSTMDRGGLVAGMVDAARSRLQDSAKTRDAAALLLSRIMTRPDLVFSFLQCKN